ncbi:hypothetical protein [Streptomyces murinus]|uniref:hypothetical protein n=1 Tax=Streptomyces murinus TaxID=33900 RepID=UPI00381F129C
MPHNDAAAPSCAKLIAAIHEIAPTAVLARVFPRTLNVAHFFEPDFYRMLIDREDEKRVTRLIKTNFKNCTDWRLAHDFYLPTGTLYLSPEPDQNGYVPEDDHSFGLTPARRIQIANGNS